LVGQIDRLARGPTSPAVSASYQIVSGYFELKISRTVDERNCMVSYWGWWQYLEMHEQHSKLYWIRE